MNSSFESGKRALDLAEAAKISCKPSDSKFVGKIFSWLQVSSENTDVARRITSALERVLDRNHEDSRLVIGLCFALQEFSGLSSAEFQKKIARAIKYLDKPAAATVVKTIKNAAMGELHPKILEMKDLDAIAVLSQAPRDKIRQVEGNADLLMIGSEAINLATSGKKEIQAAVKKVKAESKKATAPRKMTQEEPLENLEMGMIMESIEETAAALPRIGAEFDPEFPAFSSELDEAALALANLLRSMPRDGKLSNLALVIEEAKKLLEMTKRELFLPEHQEFSVAH